MLVTTNVLVVIRKSTKILTAAHDELNIQDGEVLIRYCISDKKLEFAPQEHVSIDSEK